jgi:hypothetical protein
MDVLSIEAVGTILQREREADLVRRQRSKQVTGETPWTKGASTAVHAVTALFVAALGWLRVS